MKRLLLLACVMAAAPAAAQTTSADTSWVTQIAQRARAKATELQAGQRPDQRAEAQYTEAVAEMERGAFSDAALTLQAALQRSRGNAKYRGDLAYAYARAGSWPEAHEAWIQAYRAMNQNPWYLVGASLAKAQQRSWADAAGTIQLAVQADSSIIDGRMAREAASWFQQAGDGAQALAWAQLAVARDSTDGRSWLRVAAAMNARSDSSPEALTAIRKAAMLLPEDRLANALLAGLLWRSGQIDSALERAAVAAQDSSYRSFAANLYFEAGRQAISRREAARARAALARGREFAADSSQRLGIAYMMGRAELLYASELLRGLETAPNCDSARLADTVLASAQRNLTEGAPFDSARAPMFINQVLPNYRTQAANAVHSSCSGAAPARPGARPPARGRRPR